MKNLTLIVLLTQLGFSVAVPPAAIILLAVWLRTRFDLGVWVVLVGVGLGIVCAIDGLRTSLKAMDRIANRKTPDQEPPPVSFNDHD